MASWVTYARPFAKRRRLYRREWRSRAQRFGALSDAAQHWAIRWCAATEMWRDFIAHMRSGS